MVSYLIFVVSSFFLAGLIFIRLGVKDGRSFRLCFDAFGVAVIFAIFGAKIAHVLFESRGHRLSSGGIATGILDLLRDDPLHFMRILSPGYVFYGGLLFGVLALFAYLSFRQVSRPWAFADYAAPGIAVSILVGRFGCFMAGCCFGAPTDFVMSYTYKTGPLSELGPIHPVQLYDASFGLFALLFLFKWYDKKRADGQVFIGMMLCYSIWRFLTEFLRGDLGRGLYFGGLLSTSQLISLAVFSVCLVLWFYKFNKSRTRVDKTLVFRAYKAIDRHLKAPFRPLKR